MKKEEQVKPQPEPIVGPSIPPDVMAQAQSEMERRQRAQRVAQMIQSLLQQEQCMINPSALLTPNGTQFNWDVIALPLTKPS